MSFNEHNNEILRKFLTKVLVTAVLATLAVSLLYNGFALTRGGAHEGAGAQSYVNDPPRTSSVKSDEDNGRRHHNRGGKLEDAVSVHVDAGDDAASTSVLAPHDVPLNSSQYVNPCRGWCRTSHRQGEKYLTLSDCAIRQPLDRLKLALQIENCNIAMQSPDNAHEVENKLVKLAENDAFIFFRGTAGLFNIDLMCADPKFQEKKLSLPRVVSNGDFHPQNCGSQVQINGALMFGVNDFDQSFSTPFSWDLKRGATGMAMACRSRGWNDVICKTATDAFTGAYLNLAKTNITATSPVITNQDRYVEGSRLSLRSPIVTDLFRKAREAESDAEILKWLQNDFSIDIERDRFVARVDIEPLPDSHVPDFQRAVDAYLYHGVPALVLYPFGDFWKVLAVAKKHDAGTGSIGLNRFLILLRGKKSTYGGRIVLEMKQEVNSLLEIFFKYHYTESQQGKRAVDAERSAYPYTNPFYGWTNFEGKAYIVREKSKHEKTVNIDRLSPQQYVDYAIICGRALAFYHFQVRCADHACNLDDEADYERDTWAGVSNYLRSYPWGGVEGFHEEVVEFAAREVERQFTAWEQLATFVRNARLRQAPPLELLNTPAGEVVGNDC